MNFISIFNQVCSEQRIKASIVEEMLDVDYIYTCQRGYISFDFFVEMKNNQPIIVQYCIGDSVENRKFYDLERVLTDDDLAECITWMFQEVNERYDIVMKLRKRLNKVSAIRKHLRKYRK